MAFLDTLEPHWLWLILGVVLGTAEVILPGFFLIWLAAAALVTGLATLLLPIGTALQLALFAVLAVGAVYSGRRWFALNPIESDDPHLNKRGARMVGEIVTVAEAIEGGRGRVKVGDSVWSAKGPDAAAGARVRVVGVDGGVVLVEAV